MKSWDRNMTALFLCTGNSARSVIAEAMMNQESGGQVVTYSAGSHPRGAVHPAILRLLTGLGHPVDGLWSKGWGEFAAPGAPTLDYVFTVCGNAAGEVCPAWPGQPMTAHWGLPDPAPVTGSDAVIGAAFLDTYRMLANRVRVFLLLPFATVDAMSLQTRLREIGRSGRTESAA
jgi:arsenate reductase